MEEVEKQAPLENKSDYRHHSDHLIRAYCRTQLSRKLQDIHGQDGAVSQFQRHGPPLTKKNPENS
ncbi:hypothetical protein [uncultured Desulfovibrio sp.]|uniref:hypothetical protein n=1 Tax=uncultured Desulfovibrio sp. TaxID=167968 RepID=UPI00260AE1D5|nr:hypothetical protein [uncultured Desulfovibrio sp.]